VIKALFLSQIIKSNIFLVDEALLEKRKKTLEIIIKGDLNSEPYYDYYHDNNILKDLAYFSQIEKNNTSEIFNLFFKETLNENFYPKKETDDLTFINDLNNDLKCYKSLYKAKDKEFCKKQSRYVLKFNKQKNIDEKMKSFESKILSN